jgi:hypothetical protein
MRVTSDPTMKPRPASGPRDFDLASGILLMTFALQAAVTAMKDSVTI